MNEEAHENDVNSTAVDDEEIIRNNLAKVKFTPASPKFIVSDHKGSILADDDPLVLFDESEIENARISFQKICQVREPSPTNDSPEAEGESEPAPVLPPIITREQLVELINTYGEIVPKYINDLLLAQVVGKFSSSIDTEEIEEDAAIRFLERFRAPAYYFGQRLRRNAGRGEVDAVVELLVRGCSVNTADGEGLTALHYACEFNRTTVIEKLHEMTGEHLVLDAQDKYGWTPLHCAVHNGCDQSVKLLLKLGAKVDSTDNHGKTPLHVAATRNRGLLCDTLMGAGASLNIQDKHGMTPLHEAAYRGHTKLYQSLSKMNGADVGIRDALEYTAEDYLGNYSNSYPPEIPQVEN